MCSSAARCCLVIGFTVLGWMLLNTNAAAQAPLVDSDNEALQQKQLAERFMTVLQRNPRRGTALDKVYGYHIENGSIDDFVASLRERTKSNPEDGVGWLILGLVESQRGRDAEASAALERAKELRSADPLAAYYFGQSLVLIGQPTKAAAAFEQAIERKPAPADLLEIFQSLGRVHQRAQRTPEALAVWSRMEALFPGDPRVQEQIAVTLVEEGQNAEALPRYEALAKATQDDYRRTIFRTEAAELKIKLNRAQEGLADLEHVLVGLNPDNWLFREVRRRIEEVFLRTENLEGLTSYYAGWLQQHPDDVEAMARLARVLARQARVPETQTWLDKAVKLAPSRKDLRLAFIDQLVDVQRYREAIQQYAALDNIEPDHPDRLRDWGKLVLRDPSVPQEQRQAEAERIWRRLLIARPSDPVAAIQVADLFRHAGLEPQALELYQKAVELAPMSPQYREYLGEYFHILKRPEDALATWRLMAEGSRRSAANLLRLAEVFAQFGYLAEALPELAAACELDPKDFALQLKAADLQIRAERFDAALDSLARAEQLAQNDEEREAVLNQQIKTFTLQDRLVDVARQLATQLGQPTATAKTTHPQWFRLARYREALHEYREATEAINAALEREPNHIPSLSAAARIAEQAGNLQLSADLHRKLAVIDRRGRTEYLQHVAGLETQLGRIDEALAAGRELIAAAPGNADTYQFFADLCFRLGRVEEGLAALRRATRVNPNEPSLLLSLGSALAAQFRADEAIELYWQAYEKERELDDKLAVISRLTDLYLQTNHFDKLLERLERGRREADQRREMTICLAQAYQSAGDFGMARQELERLLNENTRDTQLLLQLSKLAESESDLAAAVKYQEQLTKLAPGAESEYRLANLLGRAGDNQQAAAILVRLAAQEEDQNKLLRNIDTLLASGQEDTALGIMRARQRTDSDEWELLYREGVALAKASPAEATQRFERLLGLSVPDDELARSAKGRAVGAPSAATSPLGRPSRFSRLSPSAAVRQAVGLEQRFVTSTARPTLWTPQDFSQARMAAIGWLYRLAQDAKQTDAFVAKYRQATEAENASPRQLWDWIYLRSVQQDSADALAAARRLAERGGIAEQAVYLTLLASRDAAPAGVPRAAGGEVNENTPPLDAAELALATGAFTAVRKAAASAQDFSTADLRLSVSMAQTLLAELDRAGWRDEQQRLYREVLDDAHSVEEIGAATLLAAYRQDISGLAMLIDRLASQELQGSDAAHAGPRGAAAAYTRSLVVQAASMLAGRVETAPQNALQLLDRYVSYHAAATNQRRASPLFRLASPATGSRTANYVIVYAAGGPSRSVSLAFPSPNAYFDQAALTLLRNLFETFRQRDLISDLVKHLEQRTSDAPAAEKLYAHLALAYVRAWNDEREFAIESLTKAAELVPQDLALRFEVARLQVELEQFDEALALVDSVTPPDQQTLQQRETLALDLAVRLGNHQRAREAAQRLFGLRLDADTQVTLAGQMRRLGMADEANAVLARSQRQAGNRLSTLAALMKQYQDEGQTEQAAQVAQRILRATRPVSGTQTPVGVNTADSQYRTLALQCLAQGGKLKAIIQGLEEQIQRTPSATQLYESLAEHYQLAGDTQKGLDLTAKLVELKPEDGSLRLRHAQDLYRLRKFPEACEQYKIILKKQPQLLGQRYFEVVQAFQQARKEQELIQALSAIDLKSLGQPYMVTNVISSVMRSPQSREAGLVLFKQAWQAFPAERPRLLSYLGEDAWKLPDVMDYAKQALRPTADTVRRDPWYGVNGGGMAFSGGNSPVVTSSLSRMLTGAARSNRLDELRRSVAEAAAEYPQWLAGPLLLALIDLRQKRDADVQAVCKPLLAATGVDSNLMYTRWTVGLELEAVPEHRDLAGELYRRAATNSSTISSQFQYSAAASLVHLYQKQGRKEEARSFLEQAVRGDLSRNSSLSLPASLRADNVVAIAKMFEELDDPASALKAYRDVLSNSASGDPRLSPIVIPSQPDYFKLQAQQGLQSLITRLSSRPENVIALLTPNDKAPAGAPVIDLMIGVGMPSAAPLRPIDTPLAKLLRPARLNSADESKLETHLASLAAQHPRDLSIRIISALFAVKGKDAAKAQEALDSLVQLVEQSPLEDLPAGQRPNARQRSDAAQHIGLWLVARECLKLPQQQGTGEKLAARAIAAAERQLDPGSLTSMLYERGRLLLDAQDVAAAERQWTQLIDLAIVQPRTQRQSARTTDARPSSNPTAAGPQASGPIPATASQFALAATIAQAAAEHDRVALSLRAMREVLSGGLPVQDAPKAPTDPRVRLTAVPTPAAGFSGARAAIDPQQQAVNELTSRMWQLSALWKQRQFSPAEVCELFESIVFPPHRPGEIAIYEAAATRATTQARSIDKLLVEWTIRADRGEILKQQVASRQATPKDVERGQQLLAQFSVLQAAAPQSGQEKSAAPGQPVAPAISVPPLRKAGPSAPETVAKTPKPDPPAEQSSLDSSWADLETTEPQSTRALLLLASRPQESVAFLRQKLRPLKIDAERVQTLLVNLGSDKEETWKAAYAELEYFDPRLAIDLETLMNDVTTSPARQRMVEILSQRPAGSLDDKDVSIRSVGDSGFNFFDGRASWWAEHRVERIINVKRKWNQAVRAIVLLEHIGTPDAVAILCDMASGHPEAQPTRTAVEALARIESKPVP